MISAYVQGAICPFVQKCDILSRKHIRKIGALLALLHSSLQVKMANILFHPVIGLRVYLAEHRSSRGENDGNYHFFSTDDILFYIPFCDDFGPMNLYNLVYTIFL